MYLVSVYVIVIAILCFFHTTHGRTKRCILTSVGRVKDGMLMTMWMGEVMFSCVTTHYLRMKCEYINKRRWVGIELVRFYGMLFIHVFLYETFHWNNFVVGGSVVSDFTVLMYCDDNNITILWVRLYEYLCIFGISSHTRTAHKITVTRRRSCCYITSEHIIF